MNISLLELTKNLEKNNKELIQKLINEKTKVLNKQSTDVVLEVKKTKNEIDKQVALIDSRIQEVDGKVHTHANMALLELITQAFIDLVYQNENNIAELDGRVEYIEQNGTGGGSGHSHSNLSVLNGIDQLTIDQITINKNDISYIMGVLETLFNDVELLKTDMTTVKEDITTMKQDIAWLKTFHGGSTTTSIKYDEGTYDTAQYM